MFVSLVVHNIQWRIQGVSRFPQKPRFEIGLYPGSLNTLIEQSDQNSNRALGLRWSSCSSYISSVGASHIAERGVYV